MFDKFANGEIPPRHNRDRGLLILKPHDGAAAQRARPRGGGRDLAFPSAGDNGTPSSEAAAAASGGDGDRASSGRAAGDAAAVSSPAPDSM